VPRWQVEKTAVACHLKKREGHISTAGATRTIIPDGETSSSIEAATAPKLTAAGELTIAALNEIIYSGVSTWIAYMN
jgi:hypothetical protein